MNDAARRGGDAIHSTTWLHRFGPWLWTGVVGAGSLLVFLSAVGDFGSSTRATAVAVAIWSPVLFTALGAFIAAREPGNRIALLLMGIGSGILVEFALQLAANSQPTSASWFDIAAIVLSYASFAVTMYLLLLIAFVFPTGRFSSARHRWTLRLGLIVFPALLLIAAFTEEIGPPFPTESQAWTVVNPIGFLPPWLLVMVTGVVVVGLLVMALVGIRVLTVRYRSSEVVIKAQIRWMLLGISMSAVAFVLPLVTDASKTIAGGLILTVGITTIPVSITVAITRYRLFEIDRIISRTITYALVVAVLGTVYLIVVTVVGSLLPSQNSLAVAGSTLAAAALFNPLRRRVQRRVDRRFNRSRHEAEVVEGQLAADLQTSLTVDEITTAWVEVVEDVLQPEVCGLWLNDRDTVGVDGRGG